MEPPGVFEERFEALRKVGAGGAAHVFRARDRQGGGWAAVKILLGRDPVDIERFAREAAILSELRHPGIVRYLAHGITAAGERYLAMEWLEGEDLAVRLERRGLTGGETLVLARRAADALASAHALGLTHRDLKPSNLFLVGGDVERVKIVDFGIAGLGRDGHRLTRTGALLGTPGYSAPEQIQGASVHEASADVFALGCVLFECLTGRAAFEGSTVMALLAKILLQDVPHARAVRPAIPASVDGLLSRMMARDPAARPGDAAAVLAELEALADVEAVKALGLPSDERAQEPERPPEVLTLGEQRIVTVALAADPGADDAARPSPEAVAALRAEIEPIGGRVHMLAAGGLLVTQWGPGSAIDRAERAARCALLVKGRLAALPVCVISGRGEVAAQIADGELIERAVRSLGGGAGGVWVDEATAGLLANRMHLDRRGAGFVLRPEPAPAEIAPLLLGRATPCVGRTRELAMLQGYLEGSISDSAASVVLLVGVAGSGKTRLRRELCEGLRRRGERVEILLGSCDSLGAGSALGILGDVVRRAAGLSEGDPLDVRRARLRGRLGRELDGVAAARVSAFLGELAGTPAAQADAPLRAARESARLMSEAVSAAWEDWLTAECRARPVLLALENFHWADATTARVVMATADKLRDLPLMILLLACPEVSERFPELYGARDVQTIRLGPLSRRAALELVRNALGDGADPAVVARVVERGGDNPFYLEELVRAVAAGREGALPDSVLDMVEARLDREDPEARRVLRAASVFGQRFTRGGVRALLGERADREIDSCLAALVTHELIAPAERTDVIEPADRAYVFAHALVRESAYATLTPGDRQLGHKLAGEWMERSGNAGAIALAEHFARGADPARASLWYRRAAEKALEADDLATARERAGLGVAAGATGEVLGHLRHVQAEADLWLGATASAAARAGEAIALLPVGSDAWFRATALHAAAAAKLGDHASVERRAEAAWQARPDRGAAGAQLVCLFECAGHLLAGGRAAQADALLGRLAHATRDPVALEPAVVAAMERTAAVRAELEGDPANCLAHLEAALAAFDEAGDRRRACTVRAELGVTFARLGDFESAEEVLRAALADATGARLDDVAAAVTQSLGLTLAHGGRTAEADALAQRSVESCRRLGDPGKEGAARASLALVALLAGDPQRAEREATAAAAQLGGAPSLLPLAHGVRARALLRQARVAEALASSSEAMALLQGLGSGVEVGEALVRLVYAQALAAAGNGSAYAAAAADARARLRARAAKITDPAWRERFLAAVPDHRDTLALPRG